MKARGSFAATALLLIISSAIASSPGERRATRKQKRSPETRTTSPEKVILEELVIARNGKNRQIRGCAIAGDASTINEQILALLAEKDKKNMKYQARSDQHADQSVIVNMNDIRDLQNLQQALSVVDYEPQKIVTRKTKRRIVGGSSTDLTDPISVNGEAGVRSGVAQDYGTTTYHDASRIVQPRTRAALNDPVTAMLYTRLLQRGSSIEPTSITEEPVVQPRKRPRYAVARATVEQVDVKTVAPTKKIRVKPSRRRVQAEAEDSYKAPDSSSSRSNQAVLARRSKQSHETAEEPGYLGVAQPAKRRHRKRVPTSEKRTDVGNLQASDTNSYAVTTHGPPLDQKSRRLQLLAKYDVQPRPFAVQTTRDVIENSSVERIYKKKQQSLDPIEDARTVINSAEEPQPAARSSKSTNEDASVEQSSYEILKETEPSVVKADLTGSDTAVSLDSYKKVHSTVQLSSPGSITAPYATGGPYVADNSAVPPMIAGSGVSFDAYAANAEIIRTDQAARIVPNAEEATRTSGEPKIRDAGLQGPNQAAENRPVDSYPSESSHEVDGAGHGGGGGGENSEFVKGGGTEHGQEHQATEGEKGEKGYKSWHENAESNKGHHDKEQYNNYYDEKNGKKKESDEEAAYHQESYEGENGEKGAQFGEKGEHQKGHSTKGQHFVHKKDEFEKKTEFFDEYHEDGDLEKEGEYHEEREGSKGGHHKTGTRDEKLVEAKYGEEGSHKKGGHHSEDKGHKIEQGHDARYDHEQANGSKGSQQEGKKWAYEQGTGGGQAGHKSDR